MPDILKKVHAGDPLVIPAEAYNAFIDTARAHMRSRHHGGAGDGRTPGQADGLVLVVNACETAQDRLAVLGIDGPAFPPTGTEEIQQRAFTSQVALKCVEPTDEHVGRFVILDEPLGPGCAGYAWASGLALLKIQVDDGTAATFKRAEVIEGDTAKLKASARGSALILWREAGVGDKLAVVLLNAPEPLCEHADYCPDGREGKIEPEGADVTGDPGDSESFYAKGFMYRDASGSLNPWFCIDALPISLEGLVCVDVAYSPNPSHGSPPAGTDATGNGGDKSHVYVTGHMYEDHVGKWNPWFIIDPTTFLCQHESIAPYVDEVDGGESAFTLPEARDATGDPATASHVYAKGFMYRDEAGKLNPWFALDPEGLVPLCHNYYYRPVIGSGIPGVEVPYEEGDVGVPEAAGNMAERIWWATGWMYTDAEGEQNPWIAIDPDKMFTPAERHPDDALSMDATGSLNEAGHIHATVAAFYAGEGKWAGVVALDPSKLGGPHTILSATHTDTVPLGENEKLKRGDLLIAGHQDGPEAFRWRRVERGEADAQVLYTSPGLPGWSVTSGSGAAKVVQDDGNGHLIKDYPRAFVP